jgi:hypothetical protein
VGAQFPDRLSGRWSIQPELYCRAVGPSARRPPGRVGLVARRCRRSSPAGRLVPLRIQPTRPVTCRFPDMIASSPSHDRSGSDRPRPEPGSSAGRAHNGCYTPRFRRGERRLVGHAQPNARDDDPRTGRARREEANRREHRDRHGHPDPSQPGRQQAAAHRDQRPGQHDPRDAGRAVWQQISLLAGPRLWVRSGWSRSPPFPAAVGKRGRRLYCKSVSMSLPRMK